MAKPRRRTPKKAPTRKMLPSRKTPSTAPACWKLAPGELDSIEQSIARSHAEATQLLESAKLAGDLKVQGRALKLVDDAHVKAMQFQRLTHGLHEMEHLREMDRRRQELERKEQEREQRMRDHMNASPELLETLGAALRQPETTLDMIRALLNGDAPNTLPPKENT